MVYEPVCGTNNYTYMSTCDLMRTACLTRDDTLQLVYNGECAGVTNLRGKSQFCHYSEGSLLRIEHKVNFSEGSIL